MEDKIERKIPSWLNENEDGTWTATIKGTEYVFKELSGRELESAKNIAEKKGKSEDAMIAAKSLTSPEIKESDFVDLPGSIYLKLIGAVQFVYELDNFLD